MESLYHRIVADSRTRRIGVPLLAAFFGFQSLRYLNRWFSQRALNNGVANSTWDWSKEIVVITGGNSGIGAAIVQQLASRGIKVIILDITEAPDSLRTWNCPNIWSTTNFSAPSVYAYQVDITDEAAVNSVAERVRSEHGNPTILINNAGIATPSLLLDKPMSAIRRVFDVNVIANFHTVKEFVPAMIAADHGHIVTIASMASFTTLAGNVDYCASKAAILAFHDGLRSELSLYHSAKRVRTRYVESSADGAKC